jgi:hypothetical protein
MDNTGQRELFPDLVREDDGERRAPLLTREASLQAALGTFERHMQDEGFLDQHGQGLRQRHPPVGALSGHRHAGRRDRHQEPD